MDPSHEYMVIDASNFEVQLAPLFEKIARADFIAIDLETSGTKESLPADLSDEYPGQAYELISTNATSFGALQMWITTARWEEDKYKTFTVTIPISPLVSTETDEQRKLARVIDRKTGIPQQTLERIVNERLNVADELKGSIPYLSRHEFEILRDWPCPVLSEEASSLDDNAADTTPNDQLSGQVNSMASPADKAVIQQGGLLYLIESIMGDCKVENYRKSHNRVPRQIIESLRPAEVSEQDTSKPHIDLASALGILEWKGPCLVGHNIFHDLCFIYAMFVGPLPYNLERVVDEMHLLWPRVIDTTFMMAPPKDADQSQLSLHELFDAEVGLVHLNKTRQESQNGTRRLIGDYDAGQNSYMVMTMFLKKATQLRDSIPELAPIRHESCGSSDCGKETSPDWGVCPLEHLVWGPFINYVQIGNDRSFRLEPEDESDWGDAQSGCTCQLSRGCQLERWGYCVCPGCKSAQDDVPEEVESPKGLEAGIWDIALERIQAPEPAREDENDERKAHVAS